MTDNQMELPRTFAEIRLRRLRPSDLARFQSYRQNPEAAKFQSWQPMSDAEAEQFLFDMSGVQLLQPAQWCQIAIADVSADTLIGDIGLCLADSGEETEIGITVDPLFQRKGHAFSAVSGAISLVFEATKSRRVIGITDARNDRSLRLMQSIGMRNIETQVTEFRGEHCIEHTCEIARAEWDVKSAQRRSG